MHLNLDDVSTFQKAAAILCWHADECWTRNVAESQSQGDFQDDEPSATELAEMQQESDQEGRSNRKNLANLIVKLGEAVFHDKWDKLSKGEAFDIMDAIGSFSDRDDFLDEIWKRADEQWHKAPVEHE